METICFFYFEEDRCSNKIKWITIYILTILFSCVSAGDSCHVLVAWIFPYVLSHNLDTRLDYAAPDPCPTLCKNNERNNKVKQGKYQTPLNWIAQDEGLFIFFASLFHTFHSIHLCVCLPALVNGHSHFSPFWICPFSCDRIHHHCLPSVPSWSHKRLFYNSEW